MIFCDHFALNPHQAAIRPVMCPGTMAAPLTVAALPVGQLLADQQLSAAWLARSVDSLRT